MSLWHDIHSVPKLKDKIGYIFMPPGWSHTGEFETAKTLRTQALKELKNKNLV